MSGLVKLLVLAAFLNALSWIILIPIWQYPDEQSHFAQVQDIAELGNTPKVGSNTSLEIAISEKLLETERDGMGNNKFTYHPYYHTDYTNSKEGLFENFIENLPYESRVAMVKNEATVNPPLYHIMGANFYNLFASNGLFSRVFAVRIFSLFLYTGLIVMIVNATKLIFPKDKNAQASLSAIIAFSPMLVFSTTGVLPDPLTILIFSIIFAVGVKIIRDKLSVHLLILLLAMIVLGMSTRQQFQVAIPIALLPILYDISKRVSKKITIWTFFVLTLTASALIFWTMNHQLPISIPEIGSPYPSLLFTSQFAVYLSSTLKHYFSQTLPWYWGVYKWLSLTVPYIYYQAINRIIALSLVGLIVWIATIVKNKKYNRQDVIMAFFVISIFIYFSIFIIWDFYFQKIYGYPFGIQGRYFLPLVLPITAVLFFGLKNVFQLFFKKYIGVLYFVLTFAVILFNDISLSFVASTYYENNGLKMLINQISQYKPAPFKGNIIVVIISLALLLQVIYLFKLLSNLKKNHESI